MNYSIRQLSTLSVSLYLLGLPWVVKIAHAEPKTPQVLIQADSQSFDPQTNSINARGNVMFSLPQQHLDARADEVQYFKVNQQLILIGNVRLVQRGKLMEGARIVCQLKTEHCQSQPG